MQHEARSELKERDHKKHDLVTIDEIFTKDLTKSTILGALVAGLSLSAYWGTTTWLPTYLVKERGLSVSDMGMFMTVLGVGMFVGYQLFGWLADAIVHEIAPIQKRRRALEADPAKVDAILWDGLARARLRAIQTLQHVRQAMGLE